MITTKRVGRARVRRAKGANTTIDDIAAAAQVSTATVSRYFNSPEMLKAKTAQRVREAVTKSGYVPNMLASELASSKSRLVAAVVPVISQSASTEAMSGLKKRILFTVAVR